MKYQKVSLLHPAPLVTPKPLVKLVMGKALRQFKFPPKHKGG